MSNPLEQPTPEAPSAADSPAPIRWQTWPVRDNRAMSIVVVLGLLLATLTVYTVTGRVMLAMLATAALMASMWRFFVPVVFELSHDGVAQRFLGRHRHIPWQAIDGYELASGGVLLLPRQDGSPMAAFRGLYIPWKSHDKEVLAQIHYHLDGPGKGRIWSNEPGK